jgi:hypothetical protein
MSGRWTDKQRKELEELRVDPDNGKKMGKRYGMKITDEEKEAKEKLEGNGGSEDNCNYCGDEATVGCKGCSARQCDICYRQDECSRCMSPLCNLCKGRHKCEPRGKEQAKGYYTVDWHEDWWEEVGEKIEEKVEEKPSSSSNRLGTSREEKVKDIVSSFRRKAMLDDVPMSLKRKRIDGNNGDQKFESMKGDKKVKTGLENKGEDGKRGKGEEELEIKGDKKIEEVNCDSKLGGDGRRFVPSRVKAGRPSREALLAAGTGS